MGVKAKLGEQERLTDLAKQINVQHREHGRRERVARKHMSSAFAHAVRAGELLLEAKPLVGEGEWLGWLKENFQGGQRTAYNYIDVARHKDDPDLQPVANESGLKGALLYLQEKRNKPRTAKQVSPAEPDEDEEERASEAREDMKQAYTIHGPLTPAWGDEGEEAGDGSLNGDKDAESPAREPGEEEERSREREIRREWKHRWGKMPPRRGGVTAVVVRGPGSKDKVGRWVIPFLPEDHKLYVEPYLGTGAVLLNKKPSDEEVVNDTNEEVVNLFDVLRDNPEALARAVRLSPFSEADLQRAYDERGMPGLEPVERARRWLVCAHQAYLRQPGVPSFSLSSADTARNSVRLWNELPEHIEEAGGRLKEVKVSCRDATELIWDKLFRREDAVIYADPPYMPGTRAPGQYINEMPVPEHVGMLEALADHPGAVFLSGYDDELYHEALAGWESWDIPGYSSTGYRREVLWMNEKAHAGALAAEARRREEASATQAPPAGTAFGMVYRQPEPREPEAPAFAAVFGALLEGGRWDSDSYGTAGEDEE